MDKYLEIKRKFELVEDKENALSMAKYMRNQFSFYGIPSPKRKEVYKELLKKEKTTIKIDWTFLDKCYEDDHREFQYLVYDYLITMNKYLVYDDIEKIKDYIIIKPWWDTIDFLCKVIGNISLRDSKVESLMIEWSLSDNIWLKRTSLQYQLNLKEKTNTEVLEQIIVNCLGSDEFFINKSIGWVLRDYSKTNPKWVKNFINKHKSNMNKLSIKEASKYI